MRDPADHEKYGFRCVAHTIELAIKDALGPNGTAPKEAIQVIDMVIFLFSFANLFLLFLINWFNRRSGAS
jgi:hypothetical protein